ncbi:hypothetical protein CEUSTIGMA_g7886.t1 [Chlamydomonas eustigma]|uniref:Dynein regulatory complex subunit 7 n=1 Tax=Chlamydomonas eustigma TaxID=1157962 RepID=A0A250XBJ4_9CHLO|nr:hypothetical protein CEUSTIGMA_g7886.t1 [Chlamydomonas eustigma]|eukprot:GAX80447.1 hypothetical protein CEUSTIGMA_g7886.t1 [Chlamydomonas eustigma]
MEAAKASLMPVGQLSIDVVEERLMEARRSYKLSLGYAGITMLPAGFVEMVKKFNPNITELELSSNNLSELPDDIEDLRYLRTLRLKYNQFKRIPAVVTRLPQMLVLEVSGNQISAVGESIGNMSLLRELDLSGNMISRVSDALCTLSKLESLSIENNRLEQLPENIGDLPSLVKLDMSNNAIRFLPLSMGHFKKIQRIDCSNNLLSRVPPSMGHLKFIKELNLRYNSLDDRYKAKVEEGLSRLLAFLREEEERERLEEVERLKPIGTPVGSYLEFRCKAESSQVVKIEGSADVTVDNRCWLRQGHTFTQVGNMMLIFGGTVVKDGSTTSDVYWITLDRMEWHLQPCKGEKPTPRYNHCAMYDEDNNRLVVFGGRTAERKRLNDVWFLDLEKWHWYRPNTEGAPPTPREQAVATFWAGNMVLFGGHAIGGRTNDLMLLDLSTWQWSQPAMAGTAPSPRQASAICVGHSNLLFVSGGRNNFVLEDLHVLDFVSKAWTEVTCSGRIPPPRHSHVLSFYKDALYLFGGLDELGAQSTAMYRMNLPPGENYNIAKPEWVEWEAELPYNKGRTTTIFQGSLSVFQLGSNTLGRVNEEDAEKGLIYFDVFKHARLDALKAKQLDEEELKPKNGKKARVHHTINIASKMPKSFNGHTQPEARMLEYVQNYKRIFEELYPYRRPLYLAPKNECGVPKFICTTIRPTQLSYTELYELDGCCNFVSDFMAFDPLEDPLHPPEYLPSPMSCLGWQSGDCFDMAVILASLLIGVGYNAYVVAGYAPHAVTLNEQTGTTCPVLEREVRAASAAAAAAAAAASGTALGGSNSVSGSKMGVNRVGTAMRSVQPANPVVEKKPKYVIKANNQLNSKYIKSQEEKAAATATADLTKDTSAADQGAAGAAPALGIAPSSTGRPAGGVDGLVCKTVHAWVLVMAGKRDVTEHMFIEPSTGRKYPLTGSPYEGIEFMWNHQNFWVCMQMPLPHSDSRAHPNNISYDLADPSKWEAVFEGHGGALSPNYLNGGDDARAGLDSRGGMMYKARTPKPSTAAGGRKGSAAAGGDSMTPPRTAEGVDDGGGDEEGGPLEPPPVVPEMPPSWVPKLSIARDAFDMRCPRGSKLMLYHQCQHEIFALFGDCSRWDGMTERLILYEDVERSVISEVRESFTRRKDKLRERRVYPLKDTTVEYFDPGSSFGLKDILTVRNDRRTMNFYHGARLDGLVSREELQGRKMVETYASRDDRLVYRSATYLQEEEDGSEDGGEESEEAQRRAQRNKGKEQKRILPIRKMAEKFARNPSVDADLDIAKRCYFLQEARIRLDYHLGESRVTRSCRTFHKDGQSQIVQVDPLAPRPLPSALLEQYQRLLLQEDECTQAIRDIEWEVSEIIRTRTNQEQNITLEMPYYDIVRIKAEQSDEEEDGDEEAAYDYLSPFLPALIGMQTLSREQALDVRERCLRALKDRLIERANIIQARLDEDTTALSKRQAAFNRDRDQMTQEEEEEYEKAVEESLFRIHILEKRLKRHEEQALHKYYELDHKLRSDPRLSALLQATS